MINADIYRWKTALETVNVGIRDIEVFFKVCKGYLNLSKECRSMSYDAMTAHTAVVFTRYMM